jgi:DNA-binding beta-propeller fold protein YncE
MIVTRNSEGEVCHTNKGSIDVKINDIKGNEVEKKVVDEQDGKYRVSYRAEKPAPYEILVNIAGQPIKNSPQKVNTLEIKAEFEYVKTFGGEELTGKENDDGEEGEGDLTFFSISLSGNKEIAVNTLGNGIKIFNLEGEYLRGLGTVCLGTGESTKQFLSFGAVFNEDKIIVNLFNQDDGNYSTHEFDLNFTYLRPIYAEPEHPGHPFGMCVTDEQNIAVCYIRRDDELGFKPCIKLLSIKQGNAIQEFDSMDDQNPYYITYGNGKYFVSYGENNHIRVFDKHGVFLYKFGKKGEMGGQFNAVAGLAVYGPDLILVCDADNNRVLLLTINRQFIRSFSRHGSGQMNGPVDVAVGSDGQVFVLEFGGRVHVWR